jgi:hypothetical protein
LQQQSATLSTTSTATASTDGITMAVTPMSSRTYNNSSASNVRSTTPRRKTPLNAEPSANSDADSELSYTGVDGLMHVMPRWIPVFDQVSGRRYTNQERINMANDFYGRKAALKQRDKPREEQYRTRQFAANERRNQGQAINHPVTNRRIQRRAHYVDLDVDSDNPTDRYETYDYNVEHQDLTESFERNPSLNTSSFYMNSYIYTLTPNMILLIPELLIPL